MSITVSIESVETADAQPTTAPNKISAKATKSTLKCKYKTTAASAVVATRVRFKPTNRNTGKLIFSRGMACGSGDRCGSKWAFSLVAASPKEFSVELKDSEVSGEADGEYEVKAYSLSEADGWST